MRISVIMPVFLGEYQFGVHRNASDPAFKFKRAVCSFLSQSFGDSELVIVSDGDTRAEGIYNMYFAPFSRIKFKIIEKQPLYGGKVRQDGIEMADGDIICYLDHDDTLGANHLETINGYFDTTKYDWVYYNDYLVRSRVPYVAELRNVEPKRNYMGTSAFAHKRSIPVVWEDGNTHDFTLVEKYLLHLPHIKIPTPEYYVCHNSGLKMDF